MGGLPRQLVLVFCVSLCFLLKGESAVSTIDTFNRPVAGDAVLVLSLRASRNLTTHIIFSLGVSPCSD